MRSYTNTKKTDTDLDNIFLCELEKNPDQRLTNAQLVELTGLSERTVRRRKARLRSQKQQNYGQPPATDTANKALPSLPVGAVQTKGKISRYTPGEGWDSAEYTMNPDVEDVLTLEQVTSVLTNSTDHPDRAELKPSDSSNRALVVALSDLQVGKVDSLGGTLELAERVNSVLTQLEDKLKAASTNTRPYKEIILVDTGDILEGFSNTVQQQQTNDLSLTDQIRFAQRTVTEAIKRLHPYAEKFTFITVPSNHCAVRTSVGSKNRSNSPDDDWGILIHDNIRDALKDNPQYKNIQFIKPSKWDEAVVYKSLAVVHGHQFSPNKGGDFFAKMVVGRQAGFGSAEVLLHGHHHNFSISLAGAGQYIIGAPTIDSGSSWFTNTTGLSSPASMLTFELNPETFLPENWIIWFPKE